eukprot:4360744-Amphidinium_carterae.2
MPTQMHLAEPISRRVQTAIQTRPTKEYHRSMTCRSLLATKPITRTSSRTRKDMLKPQGNAKVTKANKQDQHTMPQRAHESHSLTRHICPKSNRGATRHSSSKIDSMRAICNWQKRVQNGISSVVQSCTEALV